MKEIIIISRNKELCEYIITAVKKLSSDDCKTCIYADPISALAMLTEEGACDGAFVDVDSMFCDTMDFIKIVRSLDPSIPIVMISHSGRLATEGFRYDVTDYLLFPIEDVRMEEALHKMQRRTFENKQQKVYIRTFGSFNIMLNGISVPWKNSKTKELLAFLVDARGDYVSSDKIIETLWPDSEYIKAASTYHTTLHNLRKKLMENELEELLEGTRGSQRVNTDFFECDLYKFEQYIADDNRRGAFDLFKGRYLENEAYTWSHLTKLRLDMQFEELCTKL